ncbi:MAG: NUDIX domain-containing protein [Gammaproteobacteria bacterium]|nr:NUDIX domain-containing protein [Gammaproteobacteria bacterium]
MPQPVQPIIAVGAVVFHDDHVLLVQRKQAPNQGQWAIPGGKVHLGESLASAAEREILEETGVHIRAHNPVHTFELIEKDPHDNINYHYVIIDLLADYLEGQPRAADDVSAAAWIARTQLATLNINAETRKLLRERFDFY